MKRIVYAAIFILTLVFSSVSSSDEITYRKHIKPVFDTRCIACHGPDTAPEYEAEVV